MRERATLAATLASASAAAALALLAASSPRATAITFGLILIAVCVAGVVHHGSVEDRRHLFSPPVLILAYMTIGIGIKGLADIFTAESKISGVVDPTGDDFARLLTGVFVHTLLAVIALLAGYRVAAPGRRRTPLTPAPLLIRQRLQVALAAAVAITAVAVSVFVSQLGTSILTDPGFVAVEGTFGLFWLYPLMYVSIFVWALPVVNDWSAGRRARIWMIAGLFLTSLLVYILTSSKAALVNGVLVLLVCRHYALRPVRLRTVVLLAAAFLVVLPVLYLHRAVGLSSELVTRLDWRTLTAGFQIFLGRSYLADSFGAILLYTPRVYPYRYGAPWLELLYFWVPRAWWPTKPVTFSIGFGETYFSSYDQGRLSFISPTLPGDAYLNFGTPGVAVVFLLLGMLLRRWYEWSVGDRPRPETVLLYAASVYWMAISPEQTIAVVGGLLLSYLAPVALVALLARGRGMSPAGPARA